MKCAFFCQPASISLLGVEILIAVLRRAGYDVSVVFDTKKYQAWGRGGKEQHQEQDTALVRDIIETGAEVLFVYLNTSNFRRMARLFGQVKSMAPHIITCGGGPHATYAPDGIAGKPGFDYICRGEGEIAILEFMEMATGRRSALPAGIYQNKNGALAGSGFGTLVRDMDLLPYPDKSDYYANVPSARNCYSTMTGRGCYNRCTFCNSVTIRQYYRQDGFHFLRRRSVPDLMGELRVAKESYRPDYIWFCDDSFIHNKRYLREFIKGYREIGIPFGCSTIPDFFDERILEDLVSVGLANVEVGIQTLDTRTRLDLFGRRESNQDFARFVQILRSLGVYVNTDHIVNPWDGRESLKQQIGQYAKIRPSFINVFHLQYFPDTQIIVRAVERGDLKPEARHALAEGTVDTYFSGGDIPRVMTEQKDLIIFLSLVPFLPARFTQWLIDSPALALIRWLPNQVILPLRAVSALFQPGDFGGRTHLKQLLFNLLRRTPGVSRDQVEALAAAPALKGPLNLVPAKPVELRKD